MMVIPYGLTADEFCNRILEKEINRLGVDAFAHKGLVILYSGPKKRILAIVGALAINPVRSTEQAKHWKATRIDDTEIAKLLEGTKLHDYFWDTYSKDFDLVSKATRKVWGYASQRFLYTGFRHVATVVCGADPDGVFYSRELKALITENTPVKTINRVSIDHYKSIYNSHSDPKEGFRAAYLEICRTELDAALIRAQKAQTKRQIELWEDYNARKLFFELDQATTPKEQDDAMARFALASMTVHNAAIGKTSKATRPKRATPATASKSALTK